MSGIEVAGLVLGALPLIIHAITVYADGVSTVERYFKYEIPLRNLHRALEAEYVIYQNTCEELLNGIVEGNEQRAALLDKPGGPDWAKPALEERLKQRLSRAYTAYIGTMKSMKDTVSGIEALLKLDKTGKVRILCHIGGARDAAARLIDKPSSNFIHPASSEKSTTGYVSA
ncbi:hypothetical protein BK809_0006100 [Diplodia seriata]|uniref:Fungal N-terminal domain-containing protein n=1 Tax=Diplodia seriata TaxID=420778 RepID=A0A1S8B2K0_9PEZI|nr:hypothetical protein BK809_0006100 [Diplodia seriata]